MFEGRQHSSAHAGYSRYRFRTAESRADAHDRPLAEAHQKDAIGIDGICGLHFVDEAHQLRTGTVGFFFVDKEPRRRKLDVIPAVRSGSERDGSSHADDVEALVQRGGEADQVLLIAANAVKQKNDRRSLTRGRFAAGLLCDVVQAKLRHYSRF